MWVFLSTTAKFLLKHFMNIMNMFDPFNFSVQPPPPPHLPLYLNVFQYSALCSSYEMGKPVGNG